VRKNFKKESVLVIGAGAWGSAIADLLARNSHSVLLSSNLPSVVAEINTKGTNQNFLPGIKLNKNIQAIGKISEPKNLSKIERVELIFVTVPSVAAIELFREILVLKKSKTLAEDAVFVICSKGFDDQSVCFLSDSFEKITGIKNYAVLSGPNFAIEVAGKVPTVTTIAAKNKKLAEKIIAALDNQHFKAHYFSDVKTAEICGIVKNIMAIGCGIIDGLDLGVNAKSALIMKGIEEIQLICGKFKAAKDVTNPAGFGDIFLTCSSSKSRNNQLGQLIAKGKSYKEIVAESKKTYEGVSSAKSVSLIAKKMKVELPLCQTINAILTKKSSPKLISQKIVKAIL
jgi:glycerol-3-phosphate dehydrogenase (NAD(P)+)